MCYRAGWTFKEFNPYRKEDGMRNQACEICELQSQSEALKSCHIVPTEITEAAGMPPSESVELCSKCYQELNTWYSVKVTHASYDPAIKKFRDMSPTEIARSYQSAFDAFVRHKKGEKKLTGGPLTDRQNDP